jgi:hypothetical protein
MNNRLDVESKFEKVLGTKLLKDLENLTIFKNQHGNYELFNYYIITKIADKQYQVTTKTSFTTHIFYSLKNAAIWCTYDKRNNFHASTRILELDRKLASLEAKLILHKKLYKNTKNNESKLIYIAKFNEERLQKASIQRELSRYEDESKRWQLKRLATKPTIYHN